MNAAGPIVEMLVFESRCGLARARVKWRTPEGEATRLYESVNSEELLQEVGYDLDGYEMEGE